MPQFTFPLSLPTHYRDDNFFVSGCNKQAYDWIMRWPDWPSHALVLTGPEGSGKTHLAHLWAQKSGAVFLSPGKLSPETGATHCLVENIERGIDEQALFHLFNRCKEQNVSLLITCNAPPASLAFRLPDLASRLRAAPLAALEAPDDALLAASLRKQFSDRQLMVDDDVIAYLVPRIERTLAQVKTLVETIDAQSLSERKNITVPFVHKLLGYSK